MIAIPERQIRALHDARTVRVYQAYNATIADAALKLGTFVTPPFKRARMTWIKPSFLWMMYRAGWGFKDENQTRILAIDLARDGFDWALDHSCPSHPTAGMDEPAWQDLKARAPVRIQWDPERDLHLQPLPHRAIQIGLGGEAVDRYVDAWIVGITDVTALAHAVRARVQAGETDAAAAMRPVETAYPRTVW